MAAARIQYLRRLGYGLGLGFAMLLAVPAGGGTFTNAMFWGMKKPCNLSYSTASYTKWTAISNNTPTWACAAPTSYSVSPALPAGLSLNTTTGVISGTPTVKDVGTVYTVTASNAAGSTTYGITVTIAVATYTWIGGTGTNWNTAANWSGNAVPSAGHVPTFDDECGVNCNATINANVTTLGGINMRSSYTGTITQGNGITFNVDGLFTIQGGTFTGGDNTSDVSFDKFQQNGGVFTAPGRNMTVGWDNAGINLSSTDGFVITGGTFNHNSGTMIFDGSVKSSGTVRIIAVVDVNSTVTFNNLVIDAADTYASGLKTKAGLDIASGDTLIALGNLTILDGNILTGNIDLYGNLTASCDNATTPVICAEKYGNATITFKGASAQTYSMQDGANIPDMVINKTSNTDTVSPVGAGTYLTARRFNLISGTFTAPALTFTLNYDHADVANPATDGFTVASGTTFTHNSGTVVFAGEHRDHYSYVGFVVDVPTSITFYNLNIKHHDYYSVLTSGALGIASGDTLIVNHNLTLTDGKMSGGTIQVHGDLTATCASADVCYYDATESTASTVIQFVGSAAQTYSFATGNRLPTLTINKTNNGDTVSPLAGTTDLYVYKFNLIKGTFTAPSGIMTVAPDFSTATNAGETDGFTVTANGTFNHGNGTLAVTFFRMQSGGHNDGIVFDVGSTLNLYNFIVNITDSYPTSGGANGVALKITSGNTIVVNNDFTLTDGKITTGTLEFKGHATFNCSTANVCSEGGSALTVFSGGNAQTLSIAAGADYLDGAVTVNKSAETLTLSAAWPLSATNQDLTVSGGTMAMGANNIQLNRNFTNSATVTCVGGGFITAGGTKTGPGSSCY